MSKINLQPATEADFIKAVTEKQAAPVQPEQPTLPLETPNPEVKVEVKTEPKAEEKKIEQTEEKPKRKRISETLKPAYAKEEIVTEAKKEESPEILTYKNQIAELEKKIKGYEESPEYQILAEAKVAGKSLFDILDDAKGVDPKTLTPSQLFEIKLKEDGLNEEEIAEAIVDFEDKKPYEQKALTKPILKELQAQADAKKAEFLGKLKAGSKETQVEQQAQIAAAQRTQTDFDAICKDAVGKQHMGVTITQQMVDSINNKFRDGLFRKNEDGSLDARELFDTAFNGLFMGLVLNELENRLEAESYEKLEKELALTGTEGKTTRTPAGTEGFKTQKELSNYLVKNLVPVQ